MIAMPKKMTNVFFLTNPRRSKKYLYHPESMTLGFEAVEMKGITSETPMVSIADNKIDRKNKITR
jgi:hypothetical protein